MAAQAGSGAGDVHPRAPGFATRTSYTGRANVGATANHELTFKPDHPSGAGQHACDGNPAIAPAIPDNQAAIAPYR